MPAGSTVYWAGGVLHAAGANTTRDVWRQSVFVSYALGWLRTEENQYLDVPPLVAETLDPQLQKLVGYSIFGKGGLGVSDPHLLNATPALEDELSQAQQDAAARSKL